MVMSGGSEGGSPPTGPRGPSGGDAASVDDLSPRLDALEEPSSPSLPLHLQVCLGQSIRSPETRFLQPSHRVTFTHFLTRLPDFSKRNVTHGYVVSLPFMRFPPTVQCAPLRPSRASQNHSATPSVCAPCLFASRLLSYESIHVPTFVVGDTCSPGEMRGPKVYRAPKSTSLLEQGKASVWQRSTTASTQTHKSCVCVSRTV